MSEDYLLRECSAPDPATRSEALENLAYRDGSAAARHLWTAFARDRDERVRLKAMELLWLLGGDDARRAVCQARCDRSALVRKAAVALIAESNGRLLAAFAEEFARSQKRRQPSSRADRSGKSTIPPPLSASIFDIDRWSRQCLEGPPGERVKAAECLSKAFVRLGDLPNECQFSLTSRWAADCPIIGPAMAGVMLNTSHPPFPRRTAQRQCPQTAPVPELVAKAEMVWQRHREPRELLEHIGGSEEERCAAIHWLGQSGCPEARDVVVERVLRDNSAAVAAAAASALASLPIEDPLADLRGRRSLAEFQTAAAQRGARVEERLGAVLLEAPERWHGKPLPAGYDLPLVAEAVSRLLASRGSPGLDLVVQALAQSPEWVVRVGAARALVDADRAAVVAGLVPLLGSEDTAGQVLATWVLSRRSDELSLNALAKALDSPQVLVRRTAALGLWAQGARVRLVVRLTDPDYVVRWLAVQAASRLGQRIDELKDALDDPHPEVTRAAAPVLLMMPDRERRIECWNTGSNDDLRPLAARLQRLSGPEPLQVRLARASDAKTVLAERVIATYSLRGDPPAQVLLPLLRLLYDRLPLVRHAAALALKELAPTAAATCLGEIAESDRAAVVKEAAQQALKAAACP